ncbi:L-type lectin-domain containing receptor kinase IX.1 [Vitis vinifera]|uniref:L-type lectin-domain containing receptor kinase IX.1 n=1 Tax=Vitis vinifera TaxID=29760 RepID=A0A438GUB2_VITVI|nr:L-type lectin-domain containing receptor kinase IX.1 [Vitis vinifera]
MAISKSLLIHALKGDFASLLFIHLQLPNSVTLPTMAACNAGIAQLHSYTLPFLHIFMISFFSSLMVHSGNSLSFNLGNFDPNDHEIIFEGHASYSADKVIQLTSNQEDKKMNDSWVRATYYKPFQLWDKASGRMADFTTNFSFEIDSQRNSSYGDGLAFFLAPNSTQLPSDVTGASGLGLVSNNQTLNSTAKHFFAVAFDTFPNAWDPKPDHVRIDINSMKSVKNVTWLSIIKDGKIKYVSISYTASSQNMSVIFGSDYLYNKTTLQSLYYKVDLSDYLPEFVTIGFSSATGDFSEINIIHSWNFSSALQISDSAEENEEKKTGLVVGLSVGAFALVAGLGLVCFCLWKKKVSEKGEDNPDFDLSMDDDLEKGTGPRKFMYHELVLATNNFAEGEKVGEGGFGGVYKGFSRNLSSYIAVKRVSKGSDQGIKEYESEVKIISRQNLVDMGNEIQNCYGLASVLLYLHEEWEQCVVHRDVKSSNVMLDAEFNAKLGDFGLARLVDHGKGSKTTVLAGTVGYMAPEYILTGKASKELDVYSFGVVALEICSGRRCVEPNAQEDQIRLVEWVWDLYGVGKLPEAADPRLSADFDEEQMARLMVVGLWCAHPDCSLRPSIRQAINVLNSEASLPALPSKMPVPMYYAPPENNSAISSLQTSYTATTSERSQS